MYRSRRLAIFTISAALLLGGAACSDADDDDAADAPVTSTTILDDGTVEIYEVSEDGEILGTIPNDGDTASGSGTDGSSAGSDATGGGDDADTATSDGAPDGGAEDVPDEGDDGTDPGGDPANETADDAPEPPAQAAPTVSLTGQRCSGPNLIVSLTAQAGNGYRKGIRSVTAARQNEYNAWLDSAGSWLGPETGAGDVWNATLTGNRQNIGKTLRITVATDAGETIVREYPITAPC